MAQNEQLTSLALFHHCMYFKPVFWWNFYWSCFLSLWGLCFYQSVRGFLIHLYTIYVYVGIFLLLFCILSLMSHTVIGQKRSMNKKVFRHLETLTRSKKTNNLRNETTFTRVTKGIVFRNDFAQTTSFNLEWNIVHAEGSSRAVSDVTALKEIALGDLCHKHMWPKWKFPPLSVHVLIRF